MTVINRAALVFPDYPEREETKSPPLEWGQPWISPGRCRERFDYLLSQRIIPKLTSLQCPSVVLLPVLDGGMRLCTETVRWLEESENGQLLKYECMPLRVKSGHGGGEFEIVHDPDHHNALKGQVVLVVDDIADTGRTLEAVLSYVRAANPAHVFVFTFLVKSRTCCSPDFACFLIPDNLLLIGWGMDGGTGFGRDEEAIWDAADFIRARPDMHQHIGVRMVRFARDIGNSTLEQALRRLHNEGEWQGHQDIVAMLADCFQT